jgi:hypothetical protein
MGYLENRVIYMVVRLPLLTSVEREFVLMNHYFTMVHVHITTECADRSFVKFYTDHMQ